MAMKTITAVEAKTRFGEFLDMSKREPIVVTKKNRPVGVMFSIEDLQNTVWGERALKADKEGYLNEEESEQLLNQLIHADIETI